MPVDHVCPPVGRSVNEPRVLRGGSWNNNQDNARAAFRTYYNPGARSHYFGFRVVCSSPTLAAETLTAAH